MRTFGHALVYAPAGTRTDAVTDTALRVARAHGAHLRLVDVLEELPEAFFRLAPAMQIRDLEDTAVHDRHQDLEEAAAGIRAAGLRVDTDVAWGHPVLEITRQVAAFGHDLVIIPGASEGAVARTATRLVRTCPTPVWVVRDRLLPANPVVLAAVDPSLREHDRCVFDVAILEVARAVAEALTGALHVVHAWQPITEMGLRLPKSFDNARIARFLRDTERRHQRWLRTLLDEAGIAVAEACVHLVGGAPAEAVLGVAHDVGADLLVMGSARTAEAAGIFLGRTAERVLDESPVSVLALKPEGFTTPVRTRGDGRRTAVVGEPADESLL